MILLVEVASRSAILVVSRPERRRGPTKVVDVDVDDEAKSGGALSATWHAADWSTPRLKRETTKPRTPGARDLLEMFGDRLAAVIGRVNI